MAIDNDEHTQALARVEAERDALKAENAELAGSIELEDASHHYRENQLKSQLAEAVRLLRKIERRMYGEDVEHRFTDLLPDLNRITAQAEQQEAPKRGKPDWDSHSYDQIFQTSDGNWFGARAAWDFKGHISGGWEGREVSLLRDDGGFLAYGEQNPDWENSLEQRPAQEAQGTQTGEFQREDRYIVIKRKDLEKAPALMAHALRVALDGLREHLPERECLVVESDWPEYEPTWAAIQARVTGQGAQAGNDIIKLFERIISQSPADLDKATEDNPWYQVMASEVREFAAALGALGVEKTPFERGVELAKRGGSVSDAWGACKDDSEMGEVHRGLEYGRNQATPPAVPFDTERARRIVDQYDAASAATDIALMNYGGCAIEMLREAVRGTEHGQ